MTKQTKNSGINVLVVVLVLAVLGFVGYTVFNEVSVSNEIKMTSETTSITEAASITETEKITEAASSKSSIETTVKNNNFDSSSEIIFINDKLRDILSPLGWIGIVSGFPNAQLSEDGTKTTMSLETNSNLFEDEQAKQLFIMEYILSNTENHTKFIVSDGEYPTSEGTHAYLKYDDFNSVYKSFFGIDFDMSKALKSEPSYDENGDYVYYNNLRSGNNGVNVSSMEADDVVYDKSTGIYTASLAVNYSDRAAEQLGYSKGNAELIYTKDQNGNIILKSYLLM